MPTTWVLISNQIKLNNFEPNSQDQAALHLVSRKGVLKEIAEYGLSKQAISLLETEWSSFPNSKDKSVYGQPVKTHEELIKFYKETLHELSQQLFQGRII